MGDCREMPRVTGQSASEETDYLIEEIGDDDFDNFQGKPRNRGRACSPSPPQDSIPSNRSEIPAGTGLMDVVFPSA